MGFTIGIKNVKLLKSTHFKITFFSEALYILYLLYENRKHISAARKTVKVLSALSEQKNINSEIYLFITINLSIC